jgi:hypothetical protein
MKVSAIVSNVEWTKLKIDIDKNKYQNCTKRFRPHKCF